ncbi:2-hydroxyglutaryl-CoA dehydratase [Clostridium sp. 19966]|uniref:acyl-CoA dehydratase activase-related protein n=1 Tax=Clostridium sp. 19966 TaxID=2768166 RepID=UPI0028DE1AEA|nr:acyl-CoA dehydratase activase-related protein [Clostridium sp. 19966]MDT8715225.1 2-hydroxyglutaryl-CoA dehydratase [Clostridium sp. 19966]
MRIGIPKGLMYWKYGYMVEDYLKELGIDYIVSPNTDKEILDRGVNCCVDEACLPIKVFHGHVDWLKDKCDLIVVPRIMQIKKDEFICPKFCGIIEMLKSSIDNLPKLTEMPIYAFNEKNLFNWFLSISESCTSKNKSKEAFRKIRTIEKVHQKIDNKNFNINVALLGHPYSISDEFCNMNIERKLKSMDFNVFTEENVREDIIDEEIKTLFKKPFWTFARRSYGAAMYLYHTKAVDGMIYISSFGCGIDSVVIELIREQLGDFPFMIIKIDEHTGEAGLDTRIEAFKDMLERRNLNEGELPKLG